MIGSEQHNPTWINFMKCPDCIAENAHSAVSEIHRRPSLLTSIPFLDHNNVLHRHETSCTMGIFVCSRGHRFEHQVPNHCECGWVQSL